MNPAVTADKSQSGMGQGSVGWRLFVLSALGGLTLVVAVAAVAALSVRSGANAEIARHAEAVRQLVAYRLHHGPGRQYLRALEEGTVTGGARVQILPASARLGSRASGPTRLYRYPLGRPGPTQAALLVSLPDAPVRAATRSAAVRSLAVGAALLMLLLYGLSQAIRRRVVLPLARLSGSVARIRAGAYGEHVEVGGPSPVRELASGIEGLAVALADLEAQAATDPLTGIANRRFFHSALATEIKRAARESTTLALVLLDLDGFKAINDRHGHPVGDGILQTVAGRLRTTLRATDVLARVGGDEFALLLPGMTSEKALAVLERSRGDAGGSVGGVELTWCAGVAAYPHDADEPEALVACADSALYCAKSDGGPCTFVYDPNERSGARTSGDRAAVAALLELPQAIVPVFQPLVSLATGHVAGYEALARFPNPPARRPDEWFALAHRCGLGPELEALAAREALSRPGRPAGTYLSFNLSASALSSGEVLAIMPEDLTDIVIEITENERVGDPELLSAQLAPLRARGARIAIDDAGTGYSGLQQVMRIQPDIIKLDRSLVADVDTDLAKAALIDSFVRFARRTGAVVCAEGIETQEELKVLCDLDVSYGQGFGLARPAAPWASVSGWVAGTVRPRALRSQTAAGAGAEANENSDLRLARLVSRLANVRPSDELNPLTELIAREIGADEVALLRRVDSGAALESLTEHAWMGAGKPLSLSHYPTIRRVLATQDAVQILIGDASADLGELALLGQSRHASMLLTPIVAHAEVVGVMQSFSTAERPWTRTETSRARIVAHQLGTLIEAPVSGRESAPEAALAGLATQTSDHF